MSQTDPPSDPMPTDSGGSGLPADRVPVPPAAPVPPPAVAPGRPPMDECAGKPNAVKALPASPTVAPASAIPPPPPARPQTNATPDSSGPSSPSAPAPASPPPVPSGVGSAKGIRWRDELSGVGPQPNQSSTSAIPAKSPQTRPAKTQPARPQLAQPRSTLSAATASKQAETPESAESGEDRSADRITRSAPPWLVSMVFHLVVLLVLALITSPAGDAINSILLTAGQSESEDAAELAEFSINPEDSPVDTEIPVETITEAELPSVLETIEIPEPIQVQPQAVGEGEFDIAPETLPMFGGRTGALRETLLNIYGGTPETEEAVRLGLHWLRRNQRRDGSWSLRGPYDDGARRENLVAATAMAMLAFLGDGNTHQEGDFQAVVKKGIKALIKMQDRDGFFSKGRATGEEKMYAQAQATIAVCELYGLTKDSWLRPHAQAAIDFAEDSQSRKGGWRYEPKFDSDTSVTGWFMLALESGRNAGLKVKESTFKRIGYYLDSAQHGEGAGYGYQEHSPHPSTSMTAEGLLCRQYLGWSRDHPPMTVGISALLRDQPFDPLDKNVYYWYYATQVLHHYGGSPWREWNDVMRVELPKLQNKKGSEIGSFPPSGDQYGFFGRLYTTCLSIYCLEVYYRHLPLYTPREEQASQGSGSREEVIKPFDPVFDAADAVNF